MASLLLLLACHAATVAAQLEPTDYDPVHEAHGIMGSLALVFFFPLGAILLRVLDGRAAVLGHALVQFFAIILLTAAAGMGIWMARKTQQLDTYHAIIGLIVFGLAWLQLAGGILHHLSFRRTGRRTLVAHAHIRLGAIVITLGMINGGMGLMLSGDSTMGEHIAYGVIAGVIWVVWLATVVWAENRRTVASESSTALLENGRPKGLD